MKALMLASLAGFAVGGAALAQDAAPALDGSARQSAETDTLTGNRAAVPGTRPATTDPVGLRGAPGGQETTGGVATNTLGPSTGAVIQPGPAGRIGTGAGAGEAPGGDGGGGSGGGGAGAGGSGGGGAGGGSGG